jgi:S1-C subfamily serine protease
MGDNHEGQGVDEPSAEVRFSPTAEPPAPHRSSIEPGTPTEPIAPLAPTPDPRSVAGPGSFAAVPGPSTQGGSGYLAPPPGATDPGPWHSTWADQNPSWAPPRPPAPTGLRPAHKAGALIAAVLLLVAGLGIGYGLWHEATSTTSASSPTGPSSTFPSRPGSSGTGSSGTGSSGTGSGVPTDISAIASKVDPGLVDINTTLSYQEEQAAGTGMVLTSSGEVLTNNHVIDGATNISVTDVGNGQTYTANVVGYDIAQDLAVLQLHGASGLQTVSIGNSANVSVGQSVVGIGNAGGTGGTPSPAGGSATALNQSITASDSGNGVSEQLNGLIETNADIQPGDSGGPLVNDSGQVIGIDTAGSAGFQFQNGAGSGFAIPINGAIAVAKQIEAGHGSTTVHIGLTAFLGVEVSPASGSGGFGGGGFGSGGTSGTGVTVAAVLTGDPAAEAGISAGDVITSFSGTTLDSPSALTAALVTHHPGDKVQIGWTDTSGQSHTATVQLVSGPPA